MAFGGEEELRGEIGIQGYWSWIFWRFGAWKLKLMGCDMMYDYR